MNGLEREIIDAELKFRNTELREPKYLVLNAYLVSDLLDLVAEYSGTPLEEAYLLNPLTYQGLIIAVTHSDSVRVEVV